MAAKYITRLLNLTATSALEGDVTPIKLWNRGVSCPNPVPNVAKMHAFGHTGYVYIPSEKRVKGEKFEPRALPGYLVGMVGELIYKM
jgi:hypothetical protein